MTDTTTSIKAEGGNLWVPGNKMSGTTRNTISQDRILNTLGVTTLIILMALFGMLVKVANTNEIQWDNNVLTVTSHKPSLLMTVILTLCIGIPLIILAATFIHGAIMSIPLKSIPKTIIKGKFFDSSAYLVMIGLSVTLLLFTSLTSLEQLPQYKKYDYTLSDTDETVRMLAYPRGKYEDKNFATYYNPDTGETMKMKVSISDLKVEPWKSTYTITHTKVDKENSNETGNTSESFLGSSDTPPVLKKVETFMTEDGKLVTLNTDGTYVLHSE